MKIRALGSQWASSSSLTLQIFTCFIIFTVAVSEFASGNELIKNVVGEDGSLVVAVDKLKEALRKGHTKRDAQAAADDAHAEAGKDKVNGVKRETVAEVAELVLPEDGQKGQAPSLEITYRVTKSSKNTPREAIDSILRKAFDKWEEQADVAFVPKENGDADIDIRFESGEHDDHEAFDGKGGIAAHAFKRTANPEKVVGAMHFDDGDDWTEDSLLRVSSFEIGKLLQILQRKDFEIEETTADAAHPQTPVVTEVSPAPTPAVTETLPAPVPTAATPTSTAEAPEYANAPFYPANPYQNVPPPGPGIGYEGPYSPYGDPYSYGISPAFPGPGYGLYNNGYYPPGPGALYGGFGPGFGAPYAGAGYGLGNYGYGNLGLGLGYDRSSLGIGIGADTFYWKNYSPKAKFALNNNDVGRIQGIYGAPNSNWLSNRHNYREKFGQQFSPASRLGPPSGSGPSRPIINGNVHGSGRPIAGIGNQPHNVPGLHNGHFNRFYNPGGPYHRPNVGYGVNTGFGNFGGAPGFPHGGHGFGIGGHQRVFRGTHGGNVGQGFSGAHGAMPGFGGRPPASHHSRHSGSGHRG